MNNRKPDTQLAEAIRNLQKEIDDKAIILKALRAQYDPEEVDYYEYIKTEAWEEMRQKVFRRDGFQCVICKEAKNLNVHHITYERLGCEEMADLVTLCQKCHEKVHQGKAIINRTGGTFVISEPQTAFCNLFTCQEAEILKCAYEMREDYSKVRPLDPDNFEKREAGQIVSKFNEGQGLPKWIQSILDDLPIWGNEYRFEVVADYYNMLWLQSQDKFLSYRMSCALLDLYLSGDEYKDEIRGQLDCIKELRDKVAEEMRSI